jgi:hypothetical protein
MRERQNGYPLSHWFEHTRQAPVAQGIERWFPKPQAAGSIPAGGTLAVIEISSYQNQISNRRPRISSGAELVLLLKHKPCRIQLLLPHFHCTRIVVREGATRKLGVEVPFGPSRQCSTALASTI